MSLQDKLNEAVKTAMREKKTLERDTLRMAVSALKNKRIDTGQDLSEGEEIAVLMKAVKQRQDAAVEYHKGGRPELAEKELAEAAVLEAFLPKQLDEAETKAAVEAAIAETGASGKQDMGKVMKAVMAKHQGLVDGKLVSQWAGQLLG
jgi:uncharacterized protein YqeY